jgi:penicillin-binding protein 2
MRVAVLGGIAFVAFAIVFFRLWFLQVLTGEEYVSQARDNRVRKVRIEAPRGDIVDRNGQELVKTRAAPVVQIIPSLLPEAERAAAASYQKARSAAERDRLAAEEQRLALVRRVREADRKMTRAERRDHARLKRQANKARAVDIPPIPTDRKLRSLYRNLSRVLEIRQSVIHERVVEGIAEAPYANVTVATGVPVAAYNYLFERRERYPAVQPTTLYLRHYPHKTLGAQLFGTLGEISERQLGEERYRDVPQGTRIGQNGLEKTYDDYLRGVPGYDRIVINAMGERDDTRRISRRQPHQGNQLRLTLDLDLQRSAENALRAAVQAAAVNGSRAGAYVAMNPRNGEIHALGSYPSFDANVFAKPISQSTYDRLNSLETGAPLFNRAITATYPTGSTFKPITAIGALQEGVLGLNQSIYDNGKFRLSANQVLQNARGASYGSLTLTRALEVSSDVFFYNLGFWANDRGPVLQKWAKRLGLGRVTGIDLPGEFAGLVPDRRWRDAKYARYQRCAKRARLDQGSQEALFECGGYERPWSVGDNVNLAIGQGDLQATPLQMAVAYSAIYNGGTIVRPHLGDQVEDGGGDVVERLRHPARRKVSMAPAFRAAVLEGLNRAAQGSNGTSASIFRGFGGDLKVYGKTGTVERIGQPDQSWYAAVVDHPTRPLTVVVTVEKGGFGAETAAPAACRIMARWYKLNPTRCRPAAVAD